MCEMIAAEVKLESNSKIYLREAELSDLPLMMAWRSNPIVYEGFYQQSKPLFWEEHKEWWESLGGSRRVLIIEYEGRPVGAVTVNGNEVGYYIGEVTLWGKGVAAQTVSMVCDILEEEGKGEVILRIRESNAASKRIAEKLNFKWSGMVWVKRFKENKKRPEWANLVKKLQGDWGLS